VRPIGVQWNNSMLNDKLIPNPESVLLPNFELASGKIPSCCLEFIWSRSFPFAFEHSEINPFSFSFKILNPPFLGFQARNETYSAVNSSLNDQMFVFDIVR